MLSKPFLSFNTFIDDDLCEHLQVKYCGELIYSREAYQSSYFFSMFHYTVPGSSESNHREKHSTMGIRIHSSYYQLFQSQKYYFVYGHPIIFPIPKSELNLLWKFTRTTFSSLEQFVQPISNKSLLLCWLPLCNYTNYRAILDHTNWNQLLSFENRLVADHSEDEISRFSIHKMIWGLKNNVFTVNMDIVYPKQDGLVLSGYFDMEDGKTIEWNALNFVDNRWYLLVGEWMFKIEGIQDYDEQQFGQWYEELEEALY